MKEVDFKLFNCYFPSGALAGCASVDAVLGSALSQEGISQVTYLLVPSLTACQLQGYA